MKTKKIIIIILVVCLLGGLLTFNGSAAGWLYDAQSWLANGFTNVAVALQGAAAALFAIRNNGDFTLFNSNFKVLPASRSRIWTTTNCVFVGMDMMREYQNYFVQIGCSTMLDLRYDKNGASAWFLRVSRFDGNEFTGDSAEMYLQLNGKWVAALNDSSAAVSSNRNNADSTDVSHGQQIYNNVENYTTNNEIIDNSTELTVFNEVTNNTEINNVFDFSTQDIYEISSGDTYDITSVSYDIDNNNYIFSYNKNNVDNSMIVEYHIQYTVVNYVDLEETYVLYYELPDGRNSYDMTVEELSQYSMSFDVINYAASADNDDLLALFPFNGNQENIAYNGNNLYWSAGNSITYQESEGFGAALYLGNGNHNFGWGNYKQDTSGAYDEIYCVSFRYYYSPWQNQTSAYYPFSVGTSGWGITYNGYTHQFSVGNFNTFTNTGAPTSGSSTTLSNSIPMPEGQWVNITIQYRYEWDYNTCDIYFFLNGVRVGNYTRTGLNSEYVSTQFDIRNGTDGYSYIDELTIIKDTYFSSSLTANFSPPLQPYDTNLILTLPSLQAVTVDSFTEDGKTYYYVYTPDQLWKPTIAVATDIPITQYYLGGARPSLPKRGYVWVPILNDVIGTVQYYDGSGWQETASRIWTGSVWVQSSSYNIHTNGTYNDLADIPPLPVIADEQSFWAWCVESFDILIETIKGSGGGGGGTVADPDVIPDIVVPGVDGDGNETEDRFSLFDIATDALGGVVKIIGKVIGLGGDVGSFFNDFADGIGDTFDVLDPNYQNGLFWVEVEQ